MTIFMEVPITKKELSDLLKCDESDVLKEFPMEIDFNDFLKSFLDGDSDDDNRVPPVGFLKGR